MKKPFWKSKTIWGFGIAALIFIGNILGAGITDNDFAQILKIVGSLWGIYGLRDALDKK